MSTSSAISCQDVFKTYEVGSGKILALSAVTAGFTEGTLTAVAGPSGSGKSSLLRILAGLERPTAGSVFVAGVSVDTASERALRRLRRGTIGYLFQRTGDNFLPGLTVGEHMKMSIRHSGTAPRIDLDTAVRLLGLSDRLQHRPDELSGGEQQRGAFAQVILSGARIVIADEPTAELDGTSAHGVIRAIRDLIDHGVTVIVATHDAAVMRAADQVLHLDHGALRSKASGGKGVYIPARARFSGGTAAGASGRRRRADEERGAPVVRLRDVSKAYRRGSETVQAVHRASLDLREEEFVGLIGRSGSGKTTLLNLVAGWERPDGGEVHLTTSGRDARGSPWSELAVVPQQLGLMEELTVRENIEYPARLASRLGEVAWLIDELIETFGLKALQSRYPTQLSVGEQQRTALARALVLSPTLLLADEPSAHQDRGWTDRVFAAIRQAVEEGTCCVAAGHDEQLLRHVDRVLRMDDGHVREQPA